MHSILKTGVGVRLYSMGYTSMSHGRILYWRRGPVPRTAQDGLYEVGGGKWMVVIPGCR